MSNKFIELTDKENERLSYYTYDPEGKKKLKEKWKKGLEEGKYWGKHAGSWDEYYEHDIRESDLWKII